tara:strand:- start:11561 stop:12544 length:984 start_codon:yes stop_codon:yes gene_type:complete
MFKNIDDTFLIKEGMTTGELDQSLSFIINQRGAKRADLERAYKNNISQTIEIPKSLYDQGVDIIIKRKINKDFKFLNLDKSVIFYSYKDRKGLSLDKIDQFKLGNIKFFPPTYLSDEIIFQQLAKGIYYRPNKLQDFNSTLLSNIAEVISTLSSLKRNEINVTNYIANMDLSKVKAEDPLNSKIIYNFIFFLKNFSSENIITTLTHGDFKFEHLFILDNKLEYVVDWENIGLRSILFDLLNFFVPWFVNRSYNYSHIKNYIHKFIKDYLPHLKDFIQDKYDIYFAIYGLERYLRLSSARSSEFNLDEAYKRYNLLLKNLSDEICTKN